MVQEKESFGFYFSAHPVDRYRHLAAANGARSFGELSAMPAPAEGGRSNGVMAGLVEEARWRTSARGRRYLMATVSDASGQYIATCFEDSVASQIEDAAKAGECLLMHVELDRRPGEEAPRVTVKSIQSFESLSLRTRIHLEAEVEDVEAVHRLAAFLGDHRGGNGVLRLRVKVDGGEADLILGRDFLLEAEMAARLERLDGVISVRLSAAEQPRLALVS